MVCRWLVVVLVAALLVPAAALAGFSATEIPIAGESVNNTFPTTATDPQGRSTVIWLQSTPPSGNLLQFRRVEPDGTVGPAVTISDGTMIVSQRVVVAAPDRRVLVVWTESVNGADPRFLRARWIAADGTLGPQVTLRNAAVTTSADEPAAVITSDGDAVVAWRNNLSTPAAGVAEARRLDASGTPGTLLQPTQGPDVAAPMGVAANASGGALVAWVAPPGIVAMPVDATGAAGTVATPVANGVLGSPTLSAGGPGAFHLLWIAQGPPAGLTTLTIDATGTASGTPHLIDGEGSFALTFRLATNADGLSLGVSGHAGGVVGASLFGVDGSPIGTTLTAPAPGEVQFATDAAVLGDGSGLLFWVQGPSGGQRSLVTRTIAPDGTGQAPVALAPRVESLGFDTTPGGVGLVTYERRNSDTGPLVVKARQLLPPPACPDASATVVQGRPTTVELPCSGLQLAAPAIVTGPAHGTLGAVGPTGTVVYTPTPGFDGLDSFTFRGVNAGGTGAVQAARIQVGRDTVRPRVARFAITVGRILLKSSFRRSPARRPAFVIRTSEPSTVRVTILRKRRGAFRPFRTLASGKAATTTTLKLPKARLVPGAYRATVVVTDLAGNASASRRVGFAVLR